MLRATSKLWTAAVMGCVATLILGALFLARSFALGAMSDWIQCILLLSGALSLIPNAIRSRGRVRVFWALLATGMAFWFSYQAMWTYYEESMAAPGCARLVCRRPCAFSSHRTHDGRPGSAPPR